MEQDQNDLREMYSALHTAGAELVGPDGKAHALPQSLYLFLCELLGGLKAGNSVTILQSDAALTTVEAAKLLSVSRQFLVQTLENGEIPYHMVGTHRRLYARDVLAYKGKRDSARRKILDDLSSAETEEGLYDLVPMHDPHAG